MCQMGIQRAVVRTTSKSLTTQKPVNKSIKPIALSTKAAAGLVIKKEVPVFTEGQKVVYPGHGVGQIRAIETKEISGTQISFYMIRVLENDITVMVPVNKVENVGVRPIIGEKEVKKVYEMLRDKKIVVEQTTWNRRYREYMEKIKTGSVLRSLRFFATFVYCELRRFCHSASSKC